MCTWVTTSARTASTGNGISSLSLAEPLVADAAPKATKPDPDDEPPAQGSLF